MLKAFNIPRELFISFFLIVITLAVFWQVKNHEFINFDDKDYVTHNLHVLAGLTPKSVAWAFTTSHTGNWHPLTWLSHMADCQMFGLKPGWHHLVNLFFHMANTLLLFLVLHRMTKALWRSAFVAALFALHPLHVESVAWVAERKDVLSTLFCMLTMGAYVYYVEHPGYRRYLLVLVFFVLGLLSKPMLVTLPFVLLLMDYWPLERFPHQQSSVGTRADTPPCSSPLKHKRKSKKKLHMVQEKVQAAKPADSLFQWTSIRPLLWEKIPFFILIIISSIITYSVQQKEGAVASVKVYSLFVRVMNAVVSYVSYIEKMIWPAKLAIFYPHPGLWPPLPVLGMALLLTVITAAVIWKMRRFPYLIIGWLWYMGTLVPVIGLVQVGAQAMADRYTYIPLIGLFIMIAWGITDLSKKWPYRIFVYTVSASIILSAFTYTTWNYLRYWQNSISIFQHTLETTKNNYSAHFSMGEALLDSGRIDEAVAHYNEALRIRPDHPDVHFNLGKVLLKQGKYEEAIGHYVTVIKIKPTDAAAYNHLGLALFHQGKIKEATINIMRSIEIMPNIAEAYNNLGAVLVSQMRYDEAVANFMKAIQINPDDMEAHYNIGVISASQGRFDNAVSHFQETVRIKPDFAMAHNNLGSVLVLQGKSEEAIVHFREALRVRPDYKLAADNLKDALAKRKKQR